MKRHARGYTLIELLILVAMIGIVTGGAWGVYGVLGAPGRPNQQAARRDRAVELLVEAQQQARLEPLATAIGAGPQVLPSRDPNLKLSRTVTRTSPGLLRVDLEASWSGGHQTEALQLVSLQREAGR